MGEEPEVTQAERRAALIERIGTFADLLCSEPLPGASGDVAYDLLRQAAAQIASDQLHLARHRTSQSESDAVRELVERLREGVKAIGIHEDNNTELFDIEDANEAMWKAAVALTRYRGEV